MPAWRCIRGLRLEWPVLRHRQRVRVAVHRGSRREHKRRTPASAAAAKTLSEPTMLTSTLSSGSTTLLLIAIDARWTT